MGACLTKVKATKIRGLVSAGVLCSVRQLGLDDWDMKEGLVVSNDPPPLSLTAAAVASVQCPVGPAPTASHAGNNSDAPPPISLWDAGTPTGGALLQVCVGLPLIESGTQTRLCRVRTPACESDVDTCCVGQPT